MNKAELDSLLKKARVPEIPAESLEIFSRQVANRLGQDESPRRTTQNFRPRLAWGFAAALCLVLAFGLGHWSGRRATNSSPDVLANARVVT
jgi:hypothetical protein